jgi:hypothetical protein
MRLPSRLFLLRCAVACLFLAVVTAFFRTKEATTEDLRRIPRSEVLAYMAEHAEPGVAAPRAAAQALVGELVFVRHPTLPLCFGYAWVDVAVLVQVDCAALTVEIAPR